MFSFISVSQGISLCLLISWLIPGSSAMPVSSKTHVAKRTTTKTTSALPSLISSRCSPPTSTGSVSDLESESYNIKKNTEWYAAHGGNLTSISKRDDTDVGGMTLDLPSDAPSIAASDSTADASADEVITASTAQVEVLTKIAGVASTGYCKSVVPGNSWNCTQCLQWVPDGKVVTSFTSTLSDTHGFILRSDEQETLYVVFRGTSSFRSAITDLVFVLTDYSPVEGAKVHAGFYSSYNQIVDDYFPILQDQLTAYPSYQVIVTGHSLGGAQALLAGMDLYQRDSRLSRKNLSIYTVGGPRVGNPTFAYYVQSTGIPFYRSVNKRDIVPHVPTQAMGFLHPGVESWIKSGTFNVQICTSDIETKYCSNSIVPFTSISDHLSYFGIDEGDCS